MKQKNIIAITLVTALLLSIPYFGKWPWTLSDFIVMGSLLFVTGIVFEFIRSRSNNKTYHAATALGICGALLLTWANMAVGIIGDEDFINTMFISIPLIGLIGSFLSHYKPQGMSKTLFLMAIVQIVIPFIALFIPNISFSPGVLHVFAINIFFSLIFTLSALMYRRAAL